MASDSEKSGLVPQMSGEDAFVELHCLLDTSVASIGHHTAAERALGRLVLNTSAACDWLTSSVGSISQTVSQAVESNGQKAKRLRASRDKRLDWLCEEFEAAKVVLEAVYLQLGSIFESNIIDLDNTLVASLGAVEELVTRTNTFATHSSVVLAGDSAFVVSAFDEISHIQTGVDGACSVVSHPPRLCRSEENRVFVACKDLFGDCVRTVRLEDVIVGVSESGDWIVRGPTVEDGTVTVSVVASTESTQSARALTLLFDVSCTRIEVHLQVCPFAALSVSRMTRIIPIRRSTAWKGRTFGLCKALV